MIVSIEYDDGRPDRKRDEQSSLRGRAEGFYVRFPNGVERRLPIGYMRVSEMATLETVFNEAILETARHTVRSVDAIYDGPGKGEQ